ncbi:MAG: hypothetical protein L0312_20045 [Acidobacteria bacterium]|nr:hypothetical protein [Acidobacteriota bacterium]
MAKTCEACSVAVSDQLLVDCACAVKVHRDGSGVDITWCPIHAQAEEMGELLQELAVSTSHEADCPRRMVGAAECTCIVARLHEVLGKAGLDV